MNQFSHAASKFSYFNGVLISFKGMVAIYCSFPLPAFLAIFTTKSKLSPTICPPSSSKSNSFSSIPGNEIYSL